MTNKQAYAEYAARDAELAARQETARDDRERFNLERLRRALAVKLEAVVHGEDDDEFIRQVERQIARSQRAA